VRLLAAVHRIDDDLFWYLLVGSQPEPKRVLRTVYALRHGRNRRLAGV
jgi:hypothetical protein